MRKLLRHLAGRANELLHPIGIQIVRVKKPAEIDPALLSFAKGLSTAEHNSLENMDEFYSSPNLLTHYFTADRLDFYQRVCRRIGSLSIRPRSVLDVGCGSGHLLAQVRELWPEAHLKGVDFSGKSIDLARRLHPNMAFEQCSIFELDRLKDSYDVVLCTEVLEHLERADQALEQLYSACLPGGHVLITVPEGRKDTFPGHFNFWTPESFSREFRRFDPIVDVIQDYLFIVIRRPSAAT